MQRAISLRVLGRSPRFRQISLCSVRGFGGHAGSSSNQRWFQGRGFFFFASFGSALLGYGIARNNQGVAATIDEPPKYGTPEDFVLAIQELRKVFPDDDVSTDPDDLHLHGFPQTEMHEGMPSTFFCEELLTRR